MNLDVSLMELALLVIAGVASATYAKSEGASQTLAAVVGVVVSLVIYWVTK